MTQSTSAASHLLHDRYTPRQLGVTAAAICLVASVASAVVFLMPHGDIWSKDLFAAWFWSTPVVGLTFLCFSATLKRLSIESSARDVTVVAPIGALVGIAWTFVVVLLLTHVIQGSGNPLVGWIATGIAALFYVTSPAERRIWSAPILIATAVGAALIGLGAYTNGL